MSNHADEVRHDTGGVDETEDHDFVSRRDRETGRGMFFTGEGDVFASDEMGQ